MLRSHACRGVMMPLAPIRKGGSVSCLVYHDLPVLDDFRHESTRKCAETTRRRKSSRTHPQKAENRPACGYRTVFCLYRKIWEWRAFRVHLCPCIIPPAAEKVECFCTRSPIMAQNAFYRAASRQKTPVNAKKGLLHSAVQQSLRGYKGLRVSGLSRAADRSSKCG